MLALAGICVSSLRGELYVQKGLTIDGSLKADYNAEELGSASCALTLDNKITF
jgi:hypothetical protein